MSYENISGIGRKLAFLRSETNRDIVSRITGVRIDMEFSPDSRYHKTAGYTGADAGGIEIAEKARDNFLRYLPEHKTPLASVTALEINLDIAPYMPLALYHNIAAFVCNNLPSLSDLYMDCSSQTFGEPGSLYIRVQRQADNGMASCDGHTSQTALFATRRPAPAHDMFPRAPRQPTVPV